MNNANQELSLDGEKKIQDENKVATSTDRKSTNKNKYLLLQII